MKKSRIQRETVLSIAAAAIAVPLIAVPAAAGLDGGRFFVKAWNVEDPSIMAIAGYGGLAHGGQIPGGGSGGTGPGGGSTDPGDGTTPGGGNGGTGPGGGTGGSNPGGGSGSTPQPGEPGSGSGADSGSSADSSSEFFNLNAGPLSFRITQNMIDFSRANEQLMAQGQMDGLKTHADGWMVIASLVNGNPDIGYQAGAQGYYLMDPMRGEAGIVAGAADGTEAQILDMRAKPADGVVTGYAFSAGTPYFTETRYATVDGKLTSLMVTRGPNGDSLSRNAEDGRSTFRSDTVPASVIKYSDGSISRIQLNRVNVVDGYNRIVIERQTNGSSTVTYDNPNSGGQAQRKLGPDTLRLDSSGKIVELFYYSGGSRRSLTGDVSVAKYNQVSGDNWDGSYAKPSDFDTRIPF